MQIYRDNRTGREVSLARIQEDGKQVHLLTDLNTGNREQVDASIISVLVPLVK